MLVIVVFVIAVFCVFLLFFFFSSRRRHTRCLSDWSSDVCSSDLPRQPLLAEARDLQRGVGPGGERPHRAPPAGDAFGAAVGRQAGVVEDDRRVEIGRASCRERVWSWVGAG